MPKYKIMVIIKRKGVDEFLDLEEESLNFEIKHNDKTYKIEGDNLYRAKLNRVFRFFDRLRGINARFISVIREGEKEPVRYKKPDVLPELLKIVGESKALSKAFKEEFRKAIGAKKTIIIVMVITFAIVIFLYYTGYLDLIL